ncbi:MAG: CDP-diacylglycerol--serine O-phosphatidyltransferase [Planctomycetes bacterium]|nr:CDP-diacylglycerol--serine O-phosphatidyltransferase [Planctomycetota bacterium]
MKFRLKRKKVLSIPFIPTIITLFNALFGFLAIVKAYQGEFVEASWYIVVAAILDGFDGKIARALNATTHFGKELDSLCDLVSFGVAPAFILFSYLKWVGYNALPVELIFCFAFFFLSCAAIRLARYNVEAHGNVLYFNGLPTPAAAGYVSATIIAINWYVKRFGSEYLWNAIILILPYFFFLIVGLLMITRVKYPHVLNTLAIKKVNLKTFAVIVLLSLLTYVFKEFALFLVTTYYVVLSPLFRKKSLQPVVKPQTEVQELPQS